jgi:hypothetical protein
MAFVIVQLPSHRDAGRWRNQNASSIEAPAFHSIDMGNRVAIQG